MRSHFVISKKVIDGEDSSIHNLVHVLHSPHSIDFCDIQQDKQFCPPDLGLIFNGLGCSQICPAVSVQKCILACGTFQMYLFSSMNITYQNMS